MKWIKRISKCRLERDTKTWVKIEAECMERNVEERVFICHTSFDQKEISQKALN